MRGPALTEGPSSGALGQPASTDGASPASTVTLLSARKSSELVKRKHRNRFPGGTREPVTTDELELLVAARVLVRVDCLEADDIPASAEVADRVVRLSRGFCGISVDEVVSAKPADHDVRPSITMQLVRADPAVNPVIAAPAKDDVVPCSRSAGCTGVVRRSRAGLSKLS